MHRTCSTHGEMRNCTDILSGNLEGNSKKKTETWQVAFITRNINSLCVEIRIFRDPAHQDLLIMQNWWAIMALRAGCHHKLQRNWGTKIPINTFHWCQNKKLTPLEVDWLLCPLSHVCVIHRVFQELVFTTLNDIFIGFRSVCNPA
jgi:hypothetical protein